MTGSFVIDVSNSKVVPILSEAVACIIHPQVATQALSAVSMRVQDSQVSLQLVQRVTRVLDGSAEGKVKAAAERSALTTALAALAHISVSQQQMGQVATAAASFCSTYYKEEGECIHVRVVLALAILAFCSCGSKADLSAASFIWLACS